MILRFLLFTVLFVNFSGIIYGALNVAKLNSNNQHQPSTIVTAESKQHRHSMDQLEPDLAQTIFGGAQKNPLERTTTVKPKIAIIRSPTLRGKRDTTLPEIKLADVKILGNDDPLPEHSHKADVEYENINADFNEDSKSEAVEAVTSVDLIIDETANLSDGTAESQKEKIIDSELAIVTSGPVEESAATTPSAPTTTAEKSSGILVQEVAPPTPKYNLTQNDNSPTENLDRKILAFEINSHNRKIFEELQKKKTAAIAAKKIEDPEFDVEATEGPKTTVFVTTTNAPVSAANEVQIDEDKKLLNEVGFSGLAKKVVAIEGPLRGSSTAPASVASATKEEVPESSAHELPQSAEVPSIDNANIEPVPTLTAELQPTQAPVETIDQEALAPSEAAPVPQSLPEDPLKHQTEVSPATPFTEAGSLSKEVFLPATTPQAIADGDFILPSSSEAAARQAALQAEANAAKVGSIEFPSQLPSIFYQRPSKNKKISKPKPEPEQPPPPPPTDAELPGFLLPHRPILDSTVSKRRHLISNYIDPIRLQKVNEKHQKEEFFRRSAAVIARERSKREEKTEQQPQYDDDIIDEKDSGESNLIVRLTTTTDDGEGENSTVTTLAITEAIKFGEASREEATTTTATVEEGHKLKLVPKKTGKAILDDQVQKSTVIHENQDSTTVAFESETSEANSTTSTPEASATSASVSEDTTPEPTTTPKPSQKSLIAQALTREEKLALLESFQPRPGTNLGKTHTPKKPPIEPIDASAEPQDPENPWTHRFKSHIQLKLTDESREVVDRTQLKILPKLVSPEVLKAQKKAELEAKKKAEKEAEFEFKDLPEAHSGDLKVDVDVVTKPTTTKAATLVASTAPASTTLRPVVQQQLQGQGGLPQSFFGRPAQQQQPQRGFQQGFQQQPQQQQQFIPQVPPGSRIIIVDGVRYLLREPPQQFLQPPQQQQQFQQHLQQPLQQPFQQPLHQQRFQQQPAQPQQFFQQPQRQLTGAAPPSPAPPPTPTTTKPQRIIHSGNAKQFTTTLSPSSSTGPRVNPEDLTIVRIFQHRGTTRQIFATTPAPTTRQTTTTPLPTEATTTQWIPVTFTTHPTPTTPFDIHLITTVKPIAKSRVRTHVQNFDVYDEVELAETATAVPKKSKKKPAQKHVETPDFEDPLISEVNFAPQEQQFRDIPLKHPPRDPPPPSFDYSDSDLITKRKPKPPKLVRLNNSGPPPAPQKPSDFIGDTPIAKADLRGLDKTIAFIS